MKMNLTQPSPSILLPTLLALVLSACGGPSTPTPTTPTPPDTSVPAPAAFTFTLPETVTVQAGSAVTLPLTVTSTAGTPQFTALNVPADLSVTFSASGVTVTAASGAAARTATLTVQGVAGTLTRQATLTVTVTAASTSAPVPVTASKTTLNATQSATLTAAAPVSWTLLSGPGTLTVNSATEALYTAPATLSAGATVTVRATSQRDAAQVTDLTLTLDNQPLTVSFPQPTIVIRAGETITVPVEVNRDVMNLTAALQPGVTVISASPTSLTLRAATNIISSSARVALRFTSGTEQVIASPHVTVTGDKALPPHYAGLDGAALPEEQELLALINAARAEPRTCGTVTYPAAPALPESATLTLVGRQHLMDTLTRGYTGHVTPEGVTPQERVWTGGYQAGVLENLHAAGADTSPQAALDAWLASPTHCTNLMKTGPAFLGVSKATLGGRVSWSLLLGGAPLGR